MEPAVAIGAAVRQLHVVGFATIRSVAPLLRIPPLALIGLGGEGRTREQRGAEKAREPRPAIL
jgi:hypothetical protein